MVFSQLMNFKRNEQEMCPKLVNYLKKNQLTSDSKANSNATLPPRGQLFTIRWTMERKKDD